MVYGLWFMVYGLWFMVYGLWFMVYGAITCAATPRWAMACGLQALWCAAFRDWTRAPRHFWLSGALLAAEAVALGGAHRQGCVQLCMTPIGQPYLCEPTTWLYFVFAQSVFAFVG